MRFLTNTSSSAEACRAAVCRRLLNEQDAAMPIRCSRDPQPLPLTAGQLVPAAEVAAGGVSRARGRSATTLSAHPHPTTSAGLRRPGGPQPAKGMGAGGARSPRAGVRPGASMTAGVDRGRVDRGCVGCIDQGCATGAWRAGGRHALIGRDQVGGVSVRRHRAR